jgi:glycosyltransferase involved in cell wall biosynthesis
MKTKIVTINLIQDLATPHNNILIAQFKDSPEVKIKLWYALDHDQQLYQWAQNISHEHFPAEIYGKYINWRFIKYCLTHRDEKFVIVGWANNSTRMISLLFFLLRRPFNHWTDLPNAQTPSISPKQKFMRWAAYKILKYSKSKVFGVGVTSMNYFRQLEFPEERLVNLPIFVEVDDDIPAYHIMRETIFAKYRIKPSDFVLSSGSRIIHEKGYDLLIKAIALLDEEIRKHVKVVIVGSGPCVSELQRLIGDLKLDKQIILEKWLAIEDFKALIANSDVFIHPARLDSYGGTTLGMALGVPVIGSYQAGAALDRIVQGCNGFLYDAEDIHTLAKFITLLYQNHELRKRMGEEARRTALQWPPRRGMEIIVENAI